MACLGLCSFCVQNRSICPKYPRGFADVRLPNAIPLPLCASLSMCGAGHANENFLDLRFFLGCVFPSVAI